MSQLEVDKIIPQSGTTLTIGDSGDTISLPSGVSLDTLTITGDLTVDTDTLYVDSTNNRVGVKNASPTVELDVTGEAKISGDLTVDTDTLYVDSSNNRLGVGTDSPSEKLTVRQTTKDVTAAKFTVDADLSSTSGDPQTVLEVRVRDNSGGTHFGQDAEIVFGNDHHSNGNFDTAKIAAGGVDDGILKFSTSSSGTLSEAMRIDNSGNLKFNSGYGSVATAYGVRAWVNFDGSAGAVSINESSDNVSSVSEVATGAYHVNLSPNFVDGNYSAGAFCNNDASGKLGSFITVTATNYFRIELSNGFGGTALKASSEVHGHAVR